MHECPFCGQACDCDGEDTWLNPPGHCQCECEDDSEDDWEHDYDDENEYDASDWRELGGEG